jgi:sulfatase maturation enzyme AslB (radical SAM superfamily)
MDMTHFKVKTPSLATKLRVEIADQDFDLEGFTLLNGVKPEFKDIAKGLERVIKTPVAAHILNLIQEQDVKQEMAFYSLVFDKLEPTANTFTLALGMMRHLMQYALNTDSLQLRSILTEEFINRGAE